MSREDDIERGQRAKEVLENPIYVEAFGAIEEELIELWKRSRSELEREDLHRKVVMLSKVQTYLRTTMDSGTLAQMRPTTVERIKDMVRSGTR